MFLVLFKIVGSGASWMTPNIKKGANWSQWIYIFVIQHIIVCDGKCSRPLYITLLVHYLSSHLDYLDLSQKNIHQAIIRMESCFWGYLQPKLSNNMNVTHADHSLISLWLTGPSGTATRGGARVGRPCPTLPSWMVEQTLPSQLHTRQPHPVGLAHLRTYQHQYLVKETHTSSALGYALLEHATQA